MTANHQLIITGMWLTAARLAFGKPTAAAWSGTPLQTDAAHWQVNCIDYPKYYFEPGDRSLALVANRNAHIISADEWVTALVSRMESTRTAPTARGVMHN
jgi:hypothetical protein